MKFRDRTRLSLETSISAQLFAGVIAAGRRDWPKLRGILAEIGSLLDQLAPQEASDACKS